MKLRIILASLAIIAYLAFAPVFWHLEYAMDDGSRDIEEKVYYNISGWPSTTFNYYLLYATNETALVDNSFSFFILDGRKTLRNFEINEMTAIVDGELFDIEEASNEIMVLDRSNTNGHGVIQGAADFRFTLPKVPANTIVVNVVGIANYDDGTSENITKNIAQTIETKEYVNTLTGYFIDLLRF